MTPPADAENKDYESHKFVNVYTVYPYNNDIAVSKLNSFFGSSNQ